MAHNTKILRFLYVNALKADVESLNSRVIVVSSCPLSWLEMLINLNDFANFVSCCEVVVGKVRIVYFSKII